MDDHGLLGGRYELGDAVGAGGSATVFRARDVRTGSAVAIKLVPPDLDGRHPGPRLRAEADALRRVVSRHVARVHDVGEDPGRGAWLAMELVEGTPLSPGGLGRPLLPHEVLRVARGLLEGLSAVHAARIVHGDVKPANVLVPRGKDALDGPKLVDFGLARPRGAHQADGPAWGTARYLAPEVLRGATPDAHADVYGAGLVLFELLGVGELFPQDGDRIRARLELEPVLAGRVPPPLSDVLLRMLAREPARRYQDASAALGAVVDLDTAPVSEIREEPETRSRIPVVPSTPSPPSPLSAPRVPDLDRPTEPPAPQASSGRPASLRASARLTALAPDGVQALGETLRHLDLPMLDALARRERGNATGRVARALALTLRLELDAAALILEPLFIQSEVARAVGAAVLAPRARRVTRARVDSDREDRWVTAVPAPLAALLVPLAVAIGAREEAARDAARCAAVLERLDAGEGADQGPPSTRDAARTTLRLAHTAARVRRGEIDPGAAVDLVAPLTGPSSRSSSRPRPGEDAPSALDRVVRGMLVATICARVDEGRAREELERAHRGASESGATLLEATVATRWGALLIEVPGRVEQGLVLLERAGTLLAHGDVPSLEHEAEHHRAAAFVVEGRWSEAIPHLRAAREAAHAERSVELEVTSAALEVVAHLALGARGPAREAAATLGEARLGSTGGRAAALAWVARSLDALAEGDHEGARDALAEASARAREAGDLSADAYVLVEVLGVLFEVARGELGDVTSPAAEIERFAREHGFTAFYWFEVLRTVLERVEDGEARAAMRSALEQLVAVLGPQSRLARERRTSAPPAGF